MIEIEKLRLQLPEGYEHRAARIVRLVGRALADRAIHRSGQWTHLRVGPLELPKGASDQQAADRIARAIHAQLPGDI